MLNLLVFALSIWEGFPILGKFFGWIPADVVPLNEQGQPWNTVIDIGEPTYTKVKPPAWAAFFAAVGLYFGFKQAKL